MNGLLMMVISLLIALLFWAYWHLLALSHTYMPHNKKAALDAATKKMCNSFKKWVYNNETACGRYMMYASRIDGELSIVPLCRALVMAKRNGIQIDSIRIERIRGKAVAVHFTLVS